MRRGRYIPSDGDAGWIEADHLRGVMREAIAKLNAGEAKAAHELLEAALIGGVIREAMKGAD